MTAAATPAAPAVAAAAAAVEVALVGAAPAAVRWLLCDTRAALAPLLAHHRRKADDFNAVQMYGTHVYMQNPRRLQHETLISLYTYTFDNN